MVIELPEELEKVLTARAFLRGVPPKIYANEILSLGLGVPEGTESPALKPFKNSRGILAKYGPAPTDEEMEENRRDMWKNFGEGF